MTQPELEVNGTVTGSADIGAPEISSAEEVKKLPVTDFLAAHERNVRQEIEAAGERDTAWNDLLAAIMQSGQTDLMDLAGAYQKASVDIEEAQAAQKASEKALREAITADLSSMKTFPESKPYPGYEWATVSKSKVFIIHDRLKTIRWLAKHRPDLLEIGGLVADKEAIIKAKLLPKADDGEPVMRMEFSPTFTLQHKALREKIAESLDNDNAATAEEL